ncbi:MAG: tail fiber domain-containing protein [Gemmatimonadetes bacterium]|nr:MAG: tail fiber domain-containing protein [Gemmatimonadota bacterium]
MYATHFNFRRLLIRGLFIMVCLLPFHAQAQDDETLSITNTNNDTLFTVGNQGVRIDLGTQPGRDAIGEFMILGQSNLREPSIWFTVQSDGNVGVGTDNPDAKFYVTGGSSTFDLSGGGNRDAIGEFTILGQSNLRDGNSPVLKATNEGNVGIGTDDPANTLHVEGGGLFNLMSPTLRDAIGEFMILGQSNLREGETDTVFVVQNSGNIGVGTGSPEATLHVKGGSRIDLNGGAGRDAIGEFAILGQTNLRETDTLFVVQNDGNVGIGIDHPEGILHVSGGNSYFDLGSDVLRDAIGEFAILGQTNLRETDTLFVVRSDGNVGVGTGNPTDNFFVAGGTTIDLTGTSSRDAIGEFAILGQTNLRETDTLFVVQNDGNVGIGTDDPGGRLHVSGGSAYFDLGSDVLRDAIGEFAILGQTNLRETDTLLVVHNDGNVGIGTDNPAGRLHVSGGSAYFDLGSDVLRDAIGEFAILGQTNLRETDSLFVVRTNGNVGIGTAQPNERLTVEGVLSLGGTTTPTPSLGYGKLYVKSSDGRLYYMNQAGTETPVTLEGSGLTGVGEAGRLAFWTGPTTLSNTPNLLWDDANSELTINGGVSGTAFTNWDMDSSNDLTVDSTFGGEVSGTYNNLMVSENIGINNGLLYAPKDGNFVGIGTNIPTRELDVAGNIEADTVYASFVGDGSNLSGISIEPDRVDSTHIINGGISGSDIRPNAINGSHIQDGSIGTDDVSTIAGSKITPNFGAQTIITTGDLSVDDIQADIVNADRIIGDGSGLLNVPATSISTNTIDSTHIINGTVSNADLRDNVVTSDKILNGAILNEDVSATAAIDGTKITPNFGNQNIITSGAISADSVSATRFAGDGSLLTNVPAVSIATNTIDSTKIIDGSISRNDLANNLIDGSKIEDGTITDSDLSTISGTKINPDFGSQNITTTGNASADTIYATAFSGDGSQLTNVQATSIATNTIDSTHVIDGGISNADLSANAVTGDKILDGTITDSDLSTISGTKINPDFGSQSIVTTGNLSAGTTSTVHTLNLQGVDSVTVKRAVTTGMMVKDITYVGGASSNSRVWQWLSDGYSLGLQAISDDYSTSTEVFSVSRSGIAISEVLFPNGNVGIGTLNPTTELDVNGTVTALDVVVQGQFTVNESGGTNDFRVEGDTDPNLIFVDAANDAVGIGTTTPTTKFEVNGTLKSSGIEELSDQRWKGNITQLQDALEKVLQLRGVNYEWLRDKFPEKDFPQGVQMGLIAQEVEKVIPEVVQTDRNGYKTINYSHLVALLIEGMKDQQREIDQLRAENEALRAAQAQNQRQIEEIRAFLGMPQSTTGIQTTQR